MIANKHVHLLCRAEPHGREVYNMSKATTAMLADVLRLGLLPFGIKVVILKTGPAMSNFFHNRLCRGLLVGVSIPLRGGSRGRYVGRRCYEGGI
jgi:NAD(P)-dependent dehydrogenase (short-subunit alcohol dehydrogenase family)